MSNECIISKEKNSFECSAVTKWIEIELTSYCGLKCVICPREKLPKYNFIKFNDFKKIIDLVKEWNYTEIMVCWLWDAFLHKDINLFLDYLFAELPDIHFFIMTKWQAIRQEHLDKIKELKEKWYNISLTFSIFSLNKKIYNYLTGWNYFNTFMNTFKKVISMNLDFSIEFLLSTLTLWELDKFKEFAKTIWKNDYWISLVHNWWWEISANIHNKLFDEWKLSGFYEKRKEGDLCEAIKYDYLYIDSFWDVFQCSLNELHRKWLLWKIWEYSLEEFLEKKRALNYKKTCEWCFYLDYKTFC